MAIGVAYGSSPPPSSISTIGSKATFVTTGAVVGTTETTIVIPAGVRAFRLHTANGNGTARLTISSSAGGTADKLTSWDLKHGNIWKEEDLQGVTTVTIYIKSNKADTDVQLLYWT